MAKILYYDIETAPNLSYVWGHFEQNVIDHEREWYMLCVSYRWEGDKKARVCSLVDFSEAYAKDPENDYHVVKKLWDLIDEADIVVAHNGDRFDMRKANARFVWHGLGPTSPVKQIDTLKVARRYFMFNSNKLDSLGQHLGLGRKVSTGGFETWAGCMRGDNKSWNLMAKYAKQDVDLLREVYLKLRPWMTNHPNLNVYDGTSNCPTCGSENLQKRGQRHTQVATYQQYLCNDCGSWSRSRLMDDTLRPDVI
jgi:DNA polymerase elongation subunit (family B)